MTVTINPDNPNILINDNGVTYELGRKGRRPIWVIEYMKEQEQTMTNTDVEPESTGELDTEPTDTKEVQVAKKVIKTSAYKDFIESFKKDSYMKDGEVVTVDDVRNLVVRCNFTMKQTGIQPMIFNADFNSVQKASDGVLIISPECFQRAAFGKNDLQHDFTLQGFTDMCAMLRGGIKTDKKANNCSCIKAVNSRVRSTDYKIVENDRLGFKADDDGENYLCDEQLYEDAVFEVKMNISLNHLVQNITGMDFAQKNILKVVEATEDEVNAFIEAGTFTTEGMVDISKIVDTVKLKIDNLKRFSHRGISAEFKIEGFTVTVDTL